CGRLPAGWAERGLPALRLGDLRAVDRRSRRLQSRWCACADFGRGFGDGRERAHTGGKRGPPVAQTLLFTPSREGSVPERATNMPDTQRTVIADCATRSVP